jgi:hypothetical protein
VIRVVNGRGIVEGEVFSGLGASTFYYRRTESGHNEGREIRPYMCDWAEVPGVPGVASTRPRTGHLVASTRLD